MEKRIILSWKKSGKLQSHCCTNPA